MLYPQFLPRCVPVAVFAFHGLPCRSEKFYDLSGSLTHFALVAACLLREASLGDPRSPRQLAMALLSVVWLTRLGTFLFTRIARDGKDGRFDAIKPNWLSFLGAWNLQAAWCVLTQLPVLLVNTKAYGTAPLSVVDGVALGLWCLGFAFECSADLEKFTFRGKPENKGKFITEGVWRYCRHPNYFGKLPARCLLTRCHAASDSDISFIVTQAFSIVLGTLIS
jgi:steroid 5-alpha reductase family enzyme